MIESNVNKELEFKIDLYVNGKLNQDQVDELWSELIQDSYYLDYTKSVANIKAVIEEQRSKNKVTPVYKLRKVINYGAAAAIAIIIGVLGIMNYSSNDSLEGIVALEQLDLGNIRGADDSPSNTNFDIIKEAIELATNGNVESAISLLESELLKENESIKVAEMSLTLGSIQYNYGEYNSALINFNRVVNQETIEDQTLEKAYWYLGNTYFQLDQLEEAEIAFQKTFELNGAYSRISKSYLDALSKKAK